MFNAALLSSGPVSGTTEYTTDGTYDFVVPFGITQLRCTVVGAGAGGAAGGLGSGGGGGAGGSLTNWLVSVFGGQVITVVVGNRGTGGSGFTINGADGQDTTVDFGNGLLTARGGKLGITNGGAGGAGGTTSATIGTGTQTNGNSGGTTVLGVGGAGGDSTQAAGGVGGPFTGTGGTGSRGSGGGGGFGSTTPAQWGPGGNGGDGYVKFEYGIPF